MRHPENGGNTVGENPFLSTLYWDFFGPSAVQTAEHFKKHLTEFLHRNAITARPIELKSEQEFHMAVVCQIDDRSAARAVAGTLRAVGRSILADASAETNADLNQPG
jgi:hypothetical protein